MYKNVYVYHIDPSDALTRNTLSLLTMLFIGEKKVDSIDEHLDEKVISNTPYYMHCLFDECHTLISIKDICVQWNLNFNLVWLHINSTLVDLIAYEYENSFIDTRPNVSDYSIGYYVCAHALWLLSFSSSSQCLLIKKKKRKFYEWNFKLFLNNFFLCLLSKCIEVSNWLDI